MIIHTTKEKLEPAILLAEQATSKNPPLPILKCLLLEATNNVLIIKATNLDLGVKIEVPAKVDSKGLVAVPGGVLKGLLSNLPNGTVTLKIKDGNLVVSTRNGSAILKSFKEDDFPVIPSITDTQNFLIPTGDLVTGLRSVWYSSAPASIKPELSSIYMAGDEEGIIFTATDSFRLAEKRIKHKKSKGFPNILIPIKNVSEIIKILEGIKGEVEIKYNKNQISFSSDGVYLISRLVEGTFPDYKQIIPSKPKSEAILLKQDLVNSLKITNVFSDKLSQVRVNLSPEQKKFEISTTNSDVGESLVKIDAAVSGEEVSLNFNYKYIADCFQSISADSLSLGFSGAGKPVLIKGVSDKSFIYIVMPMNK